MKTITSLLLLGLLVLSLISSIAESVVPKSRTRRVKASKDSSREHKDINVCDIEQEETPLYCYCNDNKLATAEDVNCLIFNRLELANPIWAHFNSQMYIRKLSFVVRNDGSFTYIPTALLRQLKSLNTISFQHAKLDAIESQAFAALPSISTINLSKNNINVLKWHAFESLMNLTVLNLDDNTITELNQDIFYNVPKLQKLFMNHNNVSVLHAKAFAHAPALQELELNNNKIATINPASFIDLRMLERLDLRNNLITMLAERSFIELPELQELDLDQNKIKYIANYAFDGLRNLKKLRLSENKLMNLEPDFLAGATMVNLLDVRENELRSLTFDNVKPIITNFYKNASYLHLDESTCPCYETLNLDCVPSVSCMMSPLYETDELSLKESVFKKIY